MPQPLKSHFSALLAALFWLGLSAFIHVTPSAEAAPADGRPGPFPLSIGRLIAQANDFYNHGDLGSAERTWTQAKAQWPALPDPPWKQQSSTTPPRTKKEPSEPGEIRGILEERLRKHPGDVETRRGLLKIAEKSGDTQAILRHRSILDVSAVPEKPIHSVALEWFSCILLLILVAWQAWKLFRELSAR